MWPRRIADEPARWLALGLAFALVPPAVAQPAAPPAPSSSAEPEAVIVTVRTNSVERGEFTLLRLPDGDYWVGAPELKRLGLDAVPAAQRQFAGETYYSLRDLGARDFVLNPQDLSLSFNLGAAHYPGTRIDLASRPPPIGEVQPQTSLILSYRLAVSQSSGQPARARLFNDANVRLGPVLLRAESELRTGPGDRRFVRQMSQVIWDDLKHGARVTAGDVVSTAGRFGSTITGGGVLVARQFELTPDLIKQPAATLQATTTLPADVELSVDGTTVMRTRVGPGPITLSNLLDYGGSRTVRLTVTDVSGRREVYEQPYLFTDQALAPGLHEYSYFAGRRSELREDGITYVVPAWQAMHHYGATDWLTIGAGGEGSREFTNLGVGATIRANLLGLLSSDVLTSHDRATGRRAAGWSARYLYTVSNGSVLLGRRRFADGFRSFTTTAARPFLRDETRAGAATRILGLTLAADLLRSEDARETRFRRSLRVSTTLQRDWTFAGQYEATRINGKREWAAHVFLRYQFGRNQWVSGNGHANADSLGLDVETGRQIGPDEGLGYRGGVTSTTGGGADMALGYFAATWNLRPATLEFYGTSQLRGPSFQFAEAAVSGALVAIDGYRGVTRAVRDSFVLARLGVPQQGVDILLNNQVQGKTDATGQLFVPQVISYGRQDVSLNEKQLKMEYSLGERKRTVTLPLRSGLVVDFGARRMRAVYGQAWLGRGPAQKKIEGTALTLSGGAAPLRLEISSSGEFYLEDAPPGRYTSPLERDGRVYACTLTIPESSDAIHEIKDGLVCE